MNRACRREGGRDETKRIGGLNCGVNGVGMPEGVWLYVSKDEFALFQPIKARSEVPPPCPNTGTSCS